MDALIKSLIIGGIFLISLGVLLIVTDGKVPFGQLPGDIKIKTDHWVIYIPLTTGALLSLILSLIFFFFRK